MNKKFKYLKILHSQFKSGVLTKREYKSELKWVRKNIKK